MREIYKKGNKSSSYIRNKNETWSNFGFLFEQTQKKKKKKKKTLSELDRKLRRKKKFGKMQVLEESSLILP